MRRFALLIEYAGTDYQGFQAQENLLTVQGALEGALSRVADSPIRTVCAGRTDAGVHALGQVVHFDTGAIRPLRAWIQGTNSIMSKSISVRHAIDAGMDFHARFSAFSRTYRYVICNTKVTSALMANRAAWIRQPLDESAMQTGADFLLGEQDFSSFRSSQCESVTAMRCVQAVQVRRAGDFVLIEITANAFLHHMVRNIAGVLIRVGMGVEPPEWVAEVLAAKDRRKAAETAAAGGLYFVRVEYPEPFGFPENRSMLFL